MPTNATCTITVAGKYMDAKVSVLEAELERKFAEAELERKVSVLEAELERKVAEAELERKVAEAELERKVVEAEAERKVAEAKLEGKMKEVENLNSFLVLKERDLLMASEAVTSRGILEFYLKECAVELGVKGNFNAAKVCDEIKKKGL
jgi:regulator of protease activity HflC (stomatin/prohibitin superfamily)